MNPFQDRVTCSICGGEGMAWAGTGYTSWFGASFTHQDPSVCEDVLARKRAEDKAANYRRAIEAYRDALRVFTYDHFPVHYAEIQTNLGVAHAFLAETDG